MKVLITGGCGFIGTNLSTFLKKKGYNISTLDNLSRKGSKFNYQILKKLKIKNYRFNISNGKRFNTLPRFDLIIDCCAEAAVEVSRKDVDRVFNTNLVGTLNVMKKVKKDKSKIIFLSSSRVYSIDALNNLIAKKVLKKKIKTSIEIKENFKCDEPKSIYGFTKHASEMLIEEFSFAYNLKYLINRCGVVSGPLQFGKQDQGFVSLWLWRHINKKKISYIGYGGNGYQLRDVLHINDLCVLIYQQILKFNKIYNERFNVGGSRKSYTSLKELTKICQDLTGNKIKISSIRKTSLYDIPYYLTSNFRVTKFYNWKPRKTFLDIANDTYKWLIDNKYNFKKYF